MIKIYISSVICCHCHIPVRLAAAFDGVGSNVVAGRPDTDQYAGDSLCLRLLLGHFRADLSNFQFFATQETV